MAELFAYFAAELRHCNEFQNRIPTGLKGAEGNEVVVGVVVGWVGCGVVVVVVVGATGLVDLGLLASGCNWRMLDVPPTLKSAIATLNARPRARVMKIFRATCMLGS